MPTQIIRAIKSDMTFDDAFDARDELRIAVDEHTSNIVYTLSQAELSGQYTPSFTYDSDINELTLQYDWNNQSDLNAFTAVLTDSAINALDSAGWILTFDPPLS